MIIFWIIIIALVILALSSLGRHRRWERDNYYGHPAGPVPHPNSALDILNERYAKGEINKEEYEQKKKDLTAP